MHEITRRHEGIYAALSPEEKNSELRTLFELMPRRMSTPPEEFDARLALSCFSQEEKQELW